MNTEDIPDEGEHEALKKKKRGPFKQSPYSFIYNQGISNPYYRLYALQQTDFRDLNKETGKV